VVYKTGNFYLVFDSQINLSGVRKPDKNFLDILHKVGHSAYFYRMSEVCAESQTLCRMSRRILSDLHIPDKLIGSQKPDQMIRFVYYAINLFVEFS
jgi:hypothetical protein